MEKIGGNKIKKLLKMPVLYKSLYRLNYIVGSKRRHDHVRKYKIM